MPRPIVGKLTSGELVLLVELLEDSLGGRAGRSLARGRSGPGGRVS